MRWITDAMAARVAAQLGLSAADFAGVISDANVLWQWIAGHEWGTEDALRQWAAALPTPIPTDRVNRALGLLQIVKRAYRFDDSPILPPAPADTAPPVYVSAAVSGTAVTITFSEALSSATTPAGSAFKIHDSAQTITATSATISGSSVQLVLPTPPAAGDTVTVDYTAPSSNPITDLAGNPSTSFTGLPVLNNTTPLAQLSGDTKEHLLERARELNVEGRSKMNVDDLRQAVADAESAQT